MGLGAAHASGDAPPLAAGVISAGCRLGADQPLPPGVLNVCPKAGDVVVISERVLHGALRWKPMGRERRFLTCRWAMQADPPPRPQDLPSDLPRRLTAAARCVGALRWASRYNVQHNLTGNPGEPPFPEAVLRRLRPETIELASYAP